MNSRLMASGSESLNLYLTLPLVNAGIAMVWTSFGTRSAEPATRYPQELNSIKPRARQAIVKAMPGLLQKFTHNLPGVFRRDLQIVRHHPKPPRARLIAILRDGPHRDPPLPRHADVGGRLMIGGANVDVARRQRLEDGVHSGILVEFDPRRDAVAVEHRH